MAKKIYTAIASGVAVMFTLAVVAPSGASASADGQQAHHPVNRRHRAARKKAIRRRAVSYICPMHPDVRANAPGTCPKCLMELVRQDAKPAQR